MADQHKTIDYLDIEKAVKLINCLEHYHLKIDDIVNDENISIDKRNTIFYINKLLECKSSYYINDQHMILCLEYLDMKTLDNIYTHTNQVINLYLYGFSLTLD